MNRDLLPNERLSLHRSNERSIMTVSDRQEKKKLSSHNQNNLETNYQPKWLINTTVDVARTYWRRNFRVTLGEDVDNNTIVEIIATSGSDAYTVTNYHSLAST